MMTSYDTKGISLRIEQPPDFPVVEQLTREAFWNVNVPGCDEHYLAHTLRRQPAFLAELDCVAELDGKIVGNIMYARTLIHKDAGGQLEVLTFGPVSVLPEYQKKGIGGALIRHTLDLARNMGFPAVVIYGDPDYYRRFGFLAGKEFGIRTLDGLYSPALLVLELATGSLQGMSGRFDEGEAYRVDPEAAAQFDRGFPPKAKAVTPSQARFQELLSQAEAPSPVERDFQAKQL